MLQRNCWPCPFCDKGIIEVLVRPSVYSLKKTRSAADGSRAYYIKTKEEVVVLSKECPNCSKSREEIEKKWRKEGII